MNEDLDTKFDAAVNALGPAASSVRGGAGDLFMEIQNPGIRANWMRCEPVTEDFFSQLNPSLPFIKAGYAPAAMDRAAFAHSPQKPDEFTAVECDGQTFHHVATPGEVVPPASAGGPIRVTVDKHHLIGFDAGRELAVMEVDGENFIEVIGLRDGDDGLVLPEGASLRTVTLAEPFVVMLPEPTTTYFWIGENIRSFQGPVELPPSKS